MNEKYPELDGMNDNCTCRGWVPRSRLDPGTRKEGQIEGPVEIVGIYTVHAGLAESPKCWNLKFADIFSYLLIIFIYLEANFSFMLINTYNLQGFKKYFLIKQSKWPKFDFNGI